MKNKITILLAGAFAAFTLLTATPAAAQNLLLTVDLSDITNVVITATTNFASVNDSSTSANDGVDLAGFFTAIISYGYSGSGTLTGGNSGGAYDSFHSDSISGTTGSGPDLNLYAGNTFDTQTFTTDSAAFTGSVTIDLSSVADNLRASDSGFTGDIYAGFSQRPGPVIGTWQIISASPTPEPGTLALGGLGALGLACLRRRR